MQTALTHKKVRMMLSHSGANFNTIFVVYFVVLSLSVDLLVDTHITLQVHCQLIAVIE